MSGEVNMIQTLRKFRGGQTKQIWGGASLETFSGESQLKKSPCIIHRNKELFNCILTAIVLCCKAGGERISRHNPLRDQLHDTAAVAAGVGPRKERLPRVHVKSSQLDCENPEVQN